LVTVTSSKRLADTDGDGEGEGEGEGAAAGAARSREAARATESMGAMIDSFSLR
jgi:hypothetical protein